jgi:hypothetical protein
VARCGGEWQRVAACGQRKKPEYPQSMALYGIVWQRKPECGSGSRTTDRGKGAATRWQVHQPVTMEVEIATEDTGQVKQQKRGMVKVSDPEKQNSCIEKSIAIHTEPIPARN